MSWLKNNLIDARKNNIRLAVIGKIVESVVVEKVDNVSNVSNVRSENSNKSDRRDNENYRNLDSGEYRSLDARKNNIKILKTEGIIVEAGLLPHDPHLDSLDEHTPTQIMTINILALRYCN